MHLLLGEAEARVSSVVPDFKASGATLVILSKRKKKKKRRKRRRNRVYSNYLNIIHGFY